MLADQIIMAAADAFGSALDDTAADLAIGDIADEEDFTGQMIARCKERLAGLTDDLVHWKTVAAITEKDDGPPRPSIRFSSRQTTSKGGATEESWSGADLLMVLDIRATDYNVRKGVLIQAKRLEPG